MKFKDNEFYVITGIKNGGYHLRCLLHFKDGEFLTINEYSNVIKEGDLLAFSFYHSISLAKDSDIIKILQCSMVSEEVDKLTKLTYDITEVR